MNKGLPVIPEAFLFSSTVKGAVYILLGFTASLFFSCHQNKTSNVYTHSEQGYYYHLIDFDTKSHKQTQGDMARLSVVYVTQHDSIFWDSFNNLGDQFFIRTDSTATDIIPSYISTCSVGDSAELLLDPQTFFQQ